jgi:hypothetical protein
MAADLSGAGKCGGEGEDGGSKRRKGNGGEARKKKEIWARGCRIPFPRGY